MSTRTSWDVWNRERKKWKPDYRGDLKTPFEQWPAIKPITARTGVASDPAAEKRMSRAGRFLQSLGAGEIRARLREFGAKGARLQKLVNAVLSGKEHLYWAMHDLDCEQMRAAGYQPRVERTGETIVTRYELRSPDGALLDERVYRFVKAAT
jgi:hypothetical protein